MPSSDAITLDDATFDVIFSTDLVYVEDCWKLCGDAHCCHFERYRKFSGPEERGMQKIPLLAGEYEYMERRNLLGQYAEFKREVTPVSLDAGEFTFDVLSIPSGGKCPCDHDRRPTICRLYPLMPVFSPAERLVGIDVNGSQFEVVEELGGIPRACQLTGTSFAEFARFLTICGAIARNPRTMYSAIVLHLFQKLFRCAIEETMERRGVNAFQAISLMTNENSFVDEASLAAEMNSLTEEFRVEFGAEFSPC